MDPEFGIWCQDPEGLVRVGLSGCWSVQGTLCPRSWCWCAALGKGWRGVLIVLLGAADCRHQLVVVASFCEPVAVVLQAVDC